MKKLFIPFLLLFLTAACSQEEPVSTQAASSARPAAAKPASPQYPACGEAYVQALRNCTPYTCRETLSSAPIIRTLSPAENGLCQETLAPQQPAENTPSPAPDSATGTASYALKQNCLFNAQQRVQMADYLQFYFASSGAEPNTPAPQNPLDEFLQNGTCTRPEKFRQGITCTGTQSVTIIFTEPDGSETRQEIFCQEPPAKPQSAAAL